VKWTGVAVVVLGSRSAAARSGDIAGSASAAIEAGVDLGSVADGDGVAGGRAGRGGSGPGSMMAGRGGASAAGPRAAAAAARAAVPAAPVVRALPAPSWMPVHPTMQRSFGTAVGRRPAVNRRCASSAGLEFTCDGVGCDYHPSLATRASMSVALTSESPRPRRLVSRRAARGGDAPLVEWRFLARHCLFVCEWFWVPVAQAGTQILQ
jgi:hypothetical protein